MIRTRTNTLLALSLAGLLALSPIAAAPMAAASNAPSLTPGTVLALQDTPHLWVVDGQGVAHFVADPKAAEGQPANWGAVRPVTLAELQAIPRGAPLVSAPLVQIGDAIYVPQEDASGEAPILLHVQSPQDLALIGVDGQNYNQLVLDPATWEQRSGLAPARLTADELRLYPAPNLTDDTGTYGPMAESLAPVA